MEKDKKNLSKPSERIEDYDKNNLESDEDLKRSDSTLEKQRSNSGLLKENSSIDIGNLHSGSAPSAGDREKTRKNNKDSIFDDDIFDDEDEVL